MNADRRAHVVAIFSADPMLAALVGAIVELAGYRAAFPHDAGDFRPQRVVALLIDATHPAARDETLLGRALMGRSRLIVFGRARELEPVKALATRYEMVMLALPEQLDELAGVLARVHPLARPPGPVKR